jgi:hypothetical protein
MTIPTFCFEASAVFIHIYGCDPYSFATRLSHMAEDLGDCESVTL